MKHLQFDKAHWVQSVRAQPLFHKEPFAGYRPSVCTAMELAVIEANRDRLDLAASYDATSTDVFVWEKGEPSEPHLTKIGGIPYRRRDLPWPECDGVEMKFVGQISFVDSKDLFRFELPDVLLVFTNSRDWSQISYETMIHTEWSRISEVAPSVIRESEMPTHAISVNAIHGVIHRTVDFLVDGEDERWQDLVGYRNLDVVHGTKIGGRAFVDEPVEHNHLCSLGAVYPGKFLFDVSLRNKSEESEVPPGSVRRKPDSDFEFSIVDMGCIAFTIDIDNRIGVTIGQSI